MNKITSLTSRRQLRCCRARTPLRPSTNRKAEFMGFLQNPSDSYLAHRGFRPFCLPVRRAVEQLIGREQVTDYIPRYFKTPALEKTHSDVYDCIQIEVELKDGSCLYLVSEKDHKSPLGIAHVFVFSCSAQPGNPIDGAFYYNGTRFGEPTGLGQWDFARVREHFLHLEELTRIDEC
jgi:hypothetical protein